MTMDVRKVQGLAAAKSTRVRALTSLNEIKQEFKKLTWPTKDELIAYTKIVIGATFTVGLGIYFIDLIVQGVLSGVSAIVQWMAG